MNRFLSITGVALLMGCGPSESRMIPGPRGDLHSDDGGSGELPVLFVHSLAGDTTHWQEQLNFFRKRTRAIALDLRGHGRSTPGSTRADYRVRDLAQDIAAVMDSLQLDRVVLVGHSMGGLVALEYAHQFPDRVAGLLLIDSAGDARQFPAEQVAGILNAIDNDPGVETTEQYWQSMLTPSSPAVREKVLSGLRAFPRLALSSITADLFRFDPAPAFATYRGPVRALGTPASENPGSLHRIKPDMAYTSVNGAGHWLQLDRPDLVNAALNEFLNEIETANP